jgi:hypothetical protein
VHTDHYYFSEEKPRKHPKKISYLAIVVISLLVTLSSAFLIVSPMRSQQDHTSFVLIKDSPVEAFVNVASEPDTAVVDQELPVARAERDAGMVEEPQPEPNHLLPDSGQNQNTGIDSTKNDPVTQSSLPAEADNKPEETGTYFDLPVIVNLNLEDKINLLSNKLYRDSDKKQLIQTLLSDIAEDAEIVSVNGDDKILKRYSPQVFLTKTMETGNHYVRIKKVIGSDNITFLKIQEIAK